MMNVVLWSLGFFWVTFFFSFLFFFSLVSFSFSGFFGLFLVGVGLFFSFSFGSFSFLFVLLCVSALVVCFVNFYSQGELFIFSFLCCLGLFVGSMILFMLGGSWFVVFLGWEGLGFSSLLLIGWFSTLFSSSASFKTAFMNRVGDVFLFFSGVVWFFCGGCLGSLILLVFSGVVKSAQFPFFAWLPAAMAAPTPVSSLVHSSTLVTAGVWLVFSSGFESVFFLVIGMISSLFGGLMAVWEKDLKKVVAFSTLSQLGFLFFCCYAVAEVCVFYLFLHAVFKSFLFMCVGLMIVVSSHNQSSGFFSGFFGVFSKFFFFVGLFSMLGFFFLAGFFLKHSVSSLLAEYGFFFFLLFFLVCLVTAVYSLRLFRFFFFPSFFSTGCGFFFLLFVSFLGCVFLGGLFPLEFSDFPFFFGLGSFLVYFSLLWSLVMVAEMCFFYVMFLSSVLFLFGFFFFSFFGGGDEFVVSVFECFVCVVLFSFFSIFGWFFLMGLVVFFLL